MEILIVCSWRKKLVTLLTFQVCDIHCFWHECVRRQQLFLILLELAWAAINLPRSRVARKLWEQDGKRGLLKHDFARSKRFSNWLICHFVRYAHLKIKNRMGPLVTNVCVKISVVRVAKVVAKFAILMSTGEKMGYTLRHKILIILRDGMHITTYYLYRTEIHPISLKGEVFSKGSHQKIPFKPFRNREQTVSPILGLTTEGICQ